MNKFMKLLLGVVMLTGITLYSADNYYWTVDGKKTDKFGPERITKQLFNKVLEKETDIKTKAMNVVDGMRKRLKSFKGDAKQKAQLSVMLHKAENMKGSIVNNQATSVEKTSESNNAASQSFSTNKMNYSLDINYKKKLQKMKDELKSLELLESQFNNFNIALSPKSNKSKKSTKNIIQDTLNNTVGGTVNNTVNNTLNGATTNTINQLNNSVTPTQILTPTPTLPSTLTPIPSEGPVTTPPLEA